MTQQPTAGPSPFAKQTSRYFKFGKEPGSSITGKIIRIGEQRQSYKYDPRPGAPKQLDFWEAAQGGAPRPKMEIPLTLQTEIRDPQDPEDDGQRILVVPIMYKEGGILSAIQKAIDLAGGQDIAVGADLWVQFTGYDPESQNPDNPRKLYAAGYRLPPAGGGAFQGQQPPAQQPQSYQQPPAAPQQSYQQPPAAPQQTAPGFGGQTATGNQQWQQPAPQQQPAQFNPIAAQQGGSGWQQPQGGQPIAPANPTPQQQQAANSFYGSGPQPGATYQPAPEGNPPGQPFGGGQQQPPAQQPQQWQQPPAQGQPPAQVDTAMIQQMIAQGAGDGDIAAATGASLQAITAIRNIGG